MTASTPDPKFDPTQDVLDTLHTARDTARVQWHLFSMEARQRWQELEQKLEGLEGKLHQTDGLVDPVAKDSTTSKLRELANSVKALLHDTRVNAEVTTPIRSLIKQSPRTCSPSDSLAQAAKLLWETDCGALPVTDAHGHVLGMVTDRDICMAAFTRGLPLHAIAVAATMSTEIHTAQPDDSLAHVARIMSKHQVRRVPVIENGVLLGVVSLADIAEHIHEKGHGGMPSSVILMQAIAGICERRGGPPVAQAAQ